MPREYSLEKPLFTFEDFNVMNGTEFQPSVQDLQQDVIDLLKEISQLMGRANSVLSSKDFGQKYGEFQKQVENEKRAINVP